MFTDSSREILVNYNVMRLNTSKTDEISLQWSRENCEGERARNCIPCLCYKYQTNRCSFVCGLILFIVAHNLEYIDRLKFSFQRPFDVTIGYVLK